MNKFLFLGTVVFSVLAFSVYKAHAQQNTAPNQESAASPKVLIAYYSYSGNTKKVAEAIHETTGGDMFEIKTDGSYPSEYRAMTQQAKKEIQDGYRPKLTTNITDIAQYDVIFLGSPNWWGTITPQVSSFLETYNLAGKKVIPFITHGSGGVQNTIADMTAQCKGCQVIQDGWVGYGSSTSALDDWLDGLGFKK